MASVHTWSKRLANSIAVVGVLLLVFSIINIHKIISNKYDNPHKIVKRQLYENDFNINSSEIYRNHATVAVPEQGDDINMTIYQDPDQEQENDDVTVTVFQDSERNQNDDDVTMTTVQDLGHQERGNNVDMAELQKLTEEGQNKEFKSGESETVTVCTHSQRLAHLQKMCSSLDKPHYADSRFIEDEKRELLYCEVSKGGCTAWKAVWQTANNSTLNQRRTYILGIHLAKSMRYAGIRTIFTYNNTKYGGYKKFISVRHPMDRVLSAYYNLVHSSRYLPGPSKAIQDKLVLVFNLKSIKELTFNQYAEFITNQTLSGIYYHDRHWKPYSDTCLVCDMKYNFITRLETNTYDSAPILESMGYNSGGNQTTIPHLHGVKRSNEEATDKPITVKFLMEYYNLSKILRKGLLERYKLDMELFGYSFDELYMKTECKITDENGNNCC